MRITTIRRAILSLRPRRTAPPMSAAVMLVGAFVLSGCAMPRRQFVPPVDPSALDDLAFTHYLATVPAVTVSEGTRACLLLVGSTDSWQSADDRLSELMRRGAVQKAWRLESDRLLDRGTLAYMLRVLCGLRRGVNERLAEFTGLGDRRYALRSCVDAGLLDYGVPHEPVSGAELLSAITRAETLVAPSVVEADP